MQVYADTHEFVKTFTGSNRYILDYLGEEVLESDLTPKYIPVVMIVQQTVILVVENYDFGNTIR